MCKKKKYIVFVRKKMHHYDLLSLNYCSWPKYESIIHNNVSSSEKVHPLLFSLIIIHWHFCLELFWTVFACKHCLICVYFSPDSDETTLLIDGLESCGQPMGYCNVWTLILMAPIHCRGKAVCIIFLLLFLFFFSVSLSCSDPAILYIQNLWLWF